MSYKVKREQAKILYLNTDLSQKRIAENLGVTENTISSWIEKYGLRDLKAAKTITKGKVVEMTWRQIADIGQKAQDEERILTPAETDQILKLSKVIKEAEGLINVTIVMQVFLDFDKWLMDKMTSDKSMNDIELLKKINSYQNLYITNMMNNNL
ncbi:MAG: helix-turn-helix domain-containing protein [Bacteroidetes bacterium]|nr:helix-turn-helix domain-containing protein [Bacteroidota bacterium]